MLQTISDDDWGRPFGVAAAPGAGGGEGALFVSDERAGVVRRLDLSNRASATTPVVPAAVVASGLRAPQGVACSGDGERLFVCEAIRGQVVAVDVAADAKVTAFWDGLVQPSGVAVAGNMLYVASAGQHAVFAKDLRCRDETMTIAGVPGSAGNMKHGPCGDGGDATKAQLNSPYGVAVGDAGDVFVSDSFNGRIRAVSAGVIRTIAGADQSCPRGSGGQATEINIGQPRGLACSPGGMFVATTPAMVWQLRGSEMVPMVGTWVDGYNGDEGEAAEVRLNVPCGIACCGSALAIADSGNKRVCLVSWD